MRRDDRHGRRIGGAYGAKLVVLTVAFGLALRAAGVFDVVGNYFMPIDPSLKSGAIAFEFSTDGAVVPALPTGDFT